MKIFGNKGFLFINDAHPLKQLMCGCCLGLHQQIGIRMSYNIPLLTSIIPGKGDITPTSTRAIAGTVIDFEDVEHACEINEVRFPYTRRIHNLCSDSEVYATETITVESGIDYIFSFWGTGSVTFSDAAIGTLEGDGDNRVQITKLTSSTSLTITVTGSVLKAQLEKVSGTQTEASEYVSTGVLSYPYYGTGVDGIMYLSTDRSGNAINTIHGALINTGDHLSYDISNAIVQGYGSSYCEFMWDGTADPAYIFELSDGTNLNGIKAYISSGILTVIITTGGIDQVTMTKAISSDILYKLILTYEDNSVNLYLNGYFVDSDILCTIPVGLTTLNVGEDYAGTNQLNGIVRHIQQFKEVISSERAIIESESIYVEDQNGEIILDHNDDPILKN